MITKQKESKKIGGVLSVQESADYLGVSRSSFWRRTKSEDFPSKVVIDNKVGYRPEDLEKWYSDQVEKREGRRSGVTNFDYLGKGQFILKCRDLARDCAVLNAVRHDSSPLEAQKRFDWAFDKMKECYSKVFPQGCESADLGKAYDDFILAKKEIIGLVWSEIDTDGLSEEAIIAF